jgi:hypothetical protein
VSHSLFEGIQRGHNLTAWALRLERMLERVRNSLDLLGTRPELAKAAAGDLAEMELRLEALALRLSSAPAKYLDGLEAWKSLAFAVGAMMRGCASQPLLAATDLKELVVKYCPPQDRSSWEARAPQSVWGMLEHEGAAQIIVNAHVRKSELRKLIEDQGILYWSEELDRRFRLVNTRHLNSHADAFRWIVEPWGGGRRCRFCGMVESGAVNALFPVELDRRNGRVMIDGMVVLDAGASALTHDRCRPLWIEAVATASKYRSLAEAQAADKAAGRTTRFGEPVQTPAPARKALAK